MSRQDPAGETPRLPRGLELTVLNPEFQSDPHTILDRLRSACPVYRDEAIGGFWLSTYAEVRETLSDRTLWRDPDKSEPQARLIRSFKRGDEDENRSNFLFMDDPDHARLRTPVATALNKRVAAGRGMIEAIVAERLQDLEQRGDFDVLQHYAVPIATDVIARLFGVAHLDLVKFRAWSESLAKFTHPDPSDEEVAEMRAHYGELTGYLDEAIRQRRQSPEDDVISDLVAQDGVGAGLSAPEVRQSCVSLLVGGNITTADLIGSAIWLLLEHPDQRAKLMANPDLISATVEEVLRLEPPVDSTSRVASRDLTLRSCPIHEGQALHALLQAANRDPSIFPEPHRFDIGRKHTPHVAFGGGPHICIGASLARLEAQIAVLSLFKRFPRLRSEQPGAAPCWARRPFFHGIERLRVTTGE